MPELPDVENFGRYLRRTAMRKRICAVEVGSAKVLRGVSGKALKRVLRGHCLCDTRRHGKMLFVAFGDCGWLAIHFGMTGRLKYFKHLADDPKHDRLRLDFDNGYHLAYENQRLFGWVRLIDDPDAFIASEGLGPDALDPSLDEEGFAKRIRHRKGALKSALMDQKLLAGIGNVYSDEILFQARLHPRRQARELSDAQISKLFGTLRRVLSVAIDKGAGTGAVETRLPAGYLLPHRHPGAPCPRCGGEVTTLKSSGRTAYLCPRCQPPP